MNPTRLLFLVWLGMLSILPASASPGRIHVSGRLLDSSGEPIIFWSYGEMMQVQLPAEVRLYGSRTAADPLATMRTVAESYGGYFHINFEIPNGVLTRGELWYGLSIDGDRNGLSESDRFNERFEIGAVPFALAAKPVRSFTTHGGITRSGSATTEPADFVWVAPFETPAGGVEFDTMAITLRTASANTAFSFGIYDESGKLVVSSGLIEVKAAVSDAFLEVSHERIVLEPSAIYFSGAARSDGSKGSVFFPKGLVPAGPIYGRAPSTTRDGSIPPSFAPGAIAIDKWAPCLPITLTLQNSAAGTSSPSMRGEAPVKPRVRWIFPEYGPGISR